MTLPTISYKRHRFLPAIIAHPVWLYFRFPPSLRLAEEMLLEREAESAYGALRRLLENGLDWCRSKPAWHRVEVPYQTLCESEM